MYSVKISVKPDFKSKLTEKLKVSFLADTICRFSHIQANHLNFFWHIQANQASQKISVLALQSRQ